MVLSVDDSQAPNGACMVGADPTAVYRNVQTLFRGGTCAGMTDRELLERFKASRGPSAEAAFAALVARHGPMVWGVCFRFLSDPHRAADAFQATFLILVRKAGCVRVDDSLARWLYGVSRKVASRARKVAARHSTQQLAPVQANWSYTPDPARAELFAALDQELDRLPKHYRAAIILCDLAGYSHHEASRQLGCAVGTIGSRVARGREMLRGRLLRRRLGPPLGLVVTACAAESARASFPITLAEAVVRAVGQCATLPGVGAISSAVVLLVEGGLKSMSATTLKLSGAALIATTVALAGGAVCAFQNSEAKTSTAPNDAATAVSGNRDAASGQIARDDTKKKLADSSQRDSEDIKDILDILQAQLDAKELEVQREKMRLELARAIVARNQRLNERNGQLISAKDMQLAQVEAKLAEIQYEVTRTEARERKLRLDQAKRMSEKLSPEALRAYLDRLGSQTTMESLERRIGAMEQKLERILELLRAKIVDPKSKPADGESSK